MPEKRLRIHPEIRRRAEELRHPLTPAEAKLWQILRSRRLAGFKFRHQHPIGSFISDFYCAQVRLVIEIDGDSHAQQLEYDTARTAWLEEQGYQVIRFTNLEVFNNLEQVLMKIVESCQTRCGAKE
jgi:very-short-patch-repair endonuclease